MTGWLCPTTHVLVTHPPAAAGKSQPGRGPRGREEHSPFCDVEIGESISKTSSQCFFYSKN